MGSCKYSMIFGSKHQHMPPAMGMDGGPWAFQRQAALGPTSGFKPFVASALAEGIKPV